MAISKKSWPIIPHSSTHALQTPLIHHVPPLTEHHLNSRERFVWWLNSEIVKVMQRRHCSLHVGLLPWPYWRFYSDVCLSTNSAEWTKGHIKRAGQHGTIKAQTRGRLLKGQTELASLKWDVMVSQWFMESKTKKLKARLHNLLHTLPGRVRGWMSLYSVWRWRVPSRMRFSSSRRSLQFPLWLLTSLTQPRSCRLRNLENTSGEWEEFLPFVFPQPPPHHHHPHPPLLLS